MLRGMSGPLGFALGCLLGAMLFIPQGCAYDPQRVVPAMVRSPWGTDEPLICYERARNFDGLVPVDCTTAQMTRP